LIQAFEFTHELAWNTLKDFLTSRGASEKLYGSKDATRAAFAAGLIEDGATWMRMIEHRNQSSHTYNDDVAATIMEAVRTAYVPAFEAFLRRFEQLETEGEP
jgi:nucleotidyltransferase substrate binding protein (TIGR01987 family)